MSYADHIGERLIVLEPNTPGRMSGYYEANADPQAICDNLNEAIRNALDVDARYEPWEWDFEPLSFTVSPASGLVVSDGRGGGRVENGLPTFADVERAFAESCEAGGLTRIPSGSGFLYELNGRPWHCAQRCEACDRFGCFGDTGFCNDCEPAVQRAATQKERALAVVAAARELVKECAGCESAEWGCVVALAAALRALAEEKP